MQKVLFYRKGKGGKNTENRGRFPRFGQFCGKGMNERRTGVLRCSSIIRQDNGNSSTDCFKMEGRRTVRGRD